MHPALRKGPLFYNTPPFFTFTENTPISFPAYGPLYVQLTGNQRASFKRKKLYYRRRAARRAVLVKILQIAETNCTTNR